ncbi:hypothetical protein DYB26_009559 [Aphanomyces astaci]|uniref:Uncharacterized protein n=1 Tax=Aphanomyces astaci TaxID=112090 RepID=A0A3R7B7V8_APHAT|nr:hypothetical protein DYB26_009559 [Aphanomyces astaci]
MTAPVTNTWAALWLAFHLTAVSLLHYLLTLVLAVTKQFPLPGLVFPRLWLHQDLRGILTKCLASLVHHKAFLHSTLPAKHPLLASVLFGNASMTMQLTARVTIASTLMQPTGIPPHVSMHTQLETNLAAVRELPGEIRNNIEAILDAKGITSGNITHALLEELLNNAVSRIASTNDRSESPPVADDSAPLRPVHYWGGRWHMLPEDFELPSVDVATAWHYWWCGSSAREIPPLHKLSTRDMAKKQGKIYCEWNFAVNVLLEVYSSSTGATLSPPYTSASVIAAFTTITVSLSASWGLTEKGRRRRLSQVKLVTFARLARKRSRRV